VTPSSSAQSKILRASQHIDCVENLINDWLGTDAYTISSEVDPKTGYTVRRAKIKEFPPERISIVSGDVVHNLRSALDHVIYALAERHLPTPLASDVEAALMYPVIGNINQKGQPAVGADLFRSAVGRYHLAGFPTDALSFIEMEQPYYRDQSGTDFLFHPAWVLNELDRIDKHRRLALTTAYLDFQFVSIPEGVNPKTCFKQAEGPVKDDDVLVMYLGADQGVQANFSRDVALNESGLPFAGATLVGELQSLQRHVQWVGAVLERFM
jgi:hypothetical protein